MSTTNQKVQRSKSVKLNQEGTSLDNLNISPLLSSTTFQVRVKPGPFKQKGLLQQAKDKATFFNRIYEAGVVGTADINHLGKILLSSFKINDLKDKIRKIDATFQKKSSKISTVSKAIKLQMKLFVNDKGDFDLKPNSNPKEIKFFALGVPGGEDLLREEMPEMSEEELNLTSVNARQDVRPNNDTEEKSENEQEDKDEEELRQEQERDEEELGQEQERDLEDKEVSKSNKKRKRMESEGVRADESRRLQQRIFQAEEVLKKSKEELKNFERQTSKKLRVESDEKSDSAAKFADDFVKAVGLSMKRRKEEEDGFGLTKEQKSNKAKAGRILETGLLQKRYPSFCQLSGEKKVKILNLEFFPLSLLIPAQNLNLAYSYEKNLTWDGFTFAFNVLISMMSIFAPGLVEMANNHTYRCRRYKEEYSYDWWRVIKFSDECRMTSTGVPGADWENEGIERDAFRKHLLHVNPRKNTVLFRKPVWKQTGGYVEARKFSPKRSENICRFFERSVECPYYKKGFCRYRHPKQIKTGQSEPQLQERSFQGNFKQRKQAQNRFNWRK